MHYLRLPFPPPSTVTTSLRLSRELWRTSRKPRTLTKRSTTFWPPLEPSMAWDSGSLALGSSIRCVRVCHVLFTVPTTSLTLFIYLLDYPGELCLSWPDADWDGQPHPQWGGSWRSLDWSGRGRCCGRHGRIAMGTQVSKGWFLTKLFTSVSCLLLVYCFR